MESTDYKRNISRRTKNGKETKMITDRLLEQLIVPMMAADDGGSGGGDGAGEGGKSAVTPPKKEDEQIVFDSQDELDKMIEKEKGKAKRAALKEFKLSDEFKKLVAVKPSEGKGDNKDDEKNSETMKVLAELRAANKTMAAELSVFKNTTKVKKKIKELGGDDIPERVATMIARDIMSMTDEATDFVTAMDDYDFDDFIAEKEEEAAGVKTGGKKKHPNSKETDEDAHLKSKYGESKYFNE